MKLYGKELDEELAKRKEAKDKRRKQRMTLRDAANNNEMGLKPSEYYAWESGQDVCPHEEYEKAIGGVHPPFLLIDMCKKCQHIEVIAKIDDEESWEKHKEDIDEAFENHSQRQK